ncbi:MAG: response regulator [Limnobacter sp.]|nr:response regulator [Limnobacter sp.]
MFTTYIKIFASQFKRTFENMSGISVIGKEILRDENQPKSFSFVSVIPYKDLDNKVFGEFNLGFTEELMATCVADAIGQKMGLPPLEQFDTDAEDILNEFMNILVGHAISDWDAQGLSVKFSPPSVIRNKQIEKNTCPNTDVFQIVFELDRNPRENETSSRRLVMYVSFTEMQRMPVATKKVMVVEDSGMMRRVFVTTLKKSGYEVIEAVDGMDAIEKHLSFQPDLTLMDINMPNLNGLEAISKIREASPTAKFMMLTSSSRKDEVITARSLRVSGYLIKPIQPDVLLDKVGKTLACPQ